MNITVKVLYFGAAADIAGKRDESIEFPAGTSVDIALEKLLAKYNALAKLSLAFAINQEYANGNELLKDGDELALIPPVSGG